jgi:hypothetical protein
MACLRSAWVFACLASGGITAAQPPNLTGTWKMNPARSDYGPLPAPEKLTQKMEHQDPSLKITTVQGGRSGDLTSETVYSTDGRETVNKVMGAEARSTARWTGRVLHVETRLQVQGHEIQFSDRWDLSADGRSLTVARHIRSPQGEMDIKFVLEKQSPWK